MDFLLMYRFCQDLNSVCFTGKPIWVLVALYPAWNFFENFPTKFLPLKVFGTSICGPCVSLEEVEIVY